MVAGFDAAENSAEERVESEFVCAQGMRSSENDVFSVGGDISSGGLWFAGIYESRNPAKVYVR